MAERPRELRPAWLGPRDHASLAALLVAYGRHVGRPRRDLDAFLSTPLDPPARPGALRAARGVLDGLCGGKVDAEVAPARIRQVLFSAATRVDRPTALQEASRTLALSEPQLLELLFADLAAERLITAPKQWPSVSELAQRANLAIAQRALSRCHDVRLELEGSAHRIVRVAKLRGLLCRVLRGDGERAVLELSGPLSLFRATRVYGRALGSLIPQLEHCRAFELRATVDLDDGPRVLVLRTGDPLFAVGPTERFDSQVEAAFAKRFTRLTQDWDLVREPEPVAAGATLIFPDFALVHRRSQRRVLLEIVGYWTPRYLAEKLGRLREARLENLILCVSERLACEDGQMPEHARIVRFKGRVDPRAVLAVLTAN